MKNETKVEKLRREAVMMLGKLAARNPHARCTLSCKELKLLYEKILFLCKRKTISESTVDELKVLAGMLYDSPHFHSQGETLVTIFNEEGIDLKN